MPSTSATHVDQHIVRSLADLGRAAEHGDAAAAIELQLHARVRHVVPVDRQAGAGEIRRAGEADAAAVAAACRNALVPAATPSTTLLDAFGEADGADAQVVRGQRIGLLDDAQPQLGGIDAPAVRRSCRAGLRAEAGLRRAVPALGPARRLVGEDAAALEAVGRDVVGDGLQRAGVEGAGDAVRAVGAAVEQRLEVHAGDRAVLLHAGLEAHQHRMAAAVAVEDLFARQADLHRAVGQQRQLARRRSRD